MSNEGKHDAVIVISCRKWQVLEIIEHVRAKFPDVEVIYEILREEIL